jgi:hypothetical protein
MSMVDGSTNPAQELETVGHVGQELPVVEVLATVDEATGLFTTLALGFVICGTV